MGHHRGRGVVAAAAPGGLARAARGRGIRPRHHAADLRGAQGAAVPVVLRRHPDPARALALADARAPEPAQSPGRRSTLGLPGLVRAIALLRRGTGASWRDAMGAFFIWQSTSLVVARASVLGLFAKKAVFLRTPKTSEQTSWWEALRANWAESSLALLGFIAIGAALTKTNQLSGPLLAGLLLFPTLGLAAAPVNSWAARKAALPAWLRDRRTTEYRRDRRSFAAGVATGGAVAVLGVAIAAVALLFTGHQAVQSP